MARIGVSQIRSAIGAPQVFAQGEPAVGAPAGEGGGAVGEEGGAGAARRGEGAAAIGAGGLVCRWYRHPTSPTATSASKAAAPAKANRDPVRRAAGAGAPSL